MADLWDIRVLVDVQWKFVVFLQGPHFPYNETTTWNRLEKGISLKVLDYKVTSPWKCAYKFWILVGDMHFDFDTKRGKFIYNPSFGTYKLNDTNCRI